MAAQVRDLRTQARVFQNNRCSACQAPLDLPAVHFLCMHSFHQRCLGDNERECVKCAPENRTVMEIKRSLEASAADQARRAGLLLCCSRCAASAPRQRSSSFVRG